MTACTGVLLLSLCAAPVRAELPHTAFALDLRVGGGVSLGGSFFPTPSLVFGARLANRVQLGGGFSYWRFAGSSSNTVATVLASPDISIDLFRASDDKMALFLGLSLPIGGTTEGKALAIGYRAALGVRYSPHRNFAVGVEAGGQGLFYNEGSRPYSNIQSMYGALFGTFYSGRHLPPRGSSPNGAAAPPGRTTPQLASPSPVIAPPEPASPDGVRPAASP